MERPGYKSTEFWITLAVIFGIFVMAALPDTDLSATAAVSAATALAGIYTGGRSFAKRPARTSETGS